MTISVISFVCNTWIIADENWNVKDEEAATRQDEPSQSIDAVTDNPTSAASDVTLTSDVPVQTRAVNETSACTETTADTAVLVETDVSTICGLGSSSGQVDSLILTESEATVYQDTADAFTLHQASEETTLEPRDDKTVQEQMAEEHQDADNRNTETAQKIRSEADNEANGEPNVMLEVEERIRIEVPLSEDEERESVSVFSTCDEWIESPGSEKIAATVHAPALNLEDNKDLLAGLTKPDEVDPAPMTPPYKRPDMALPAATLGCSGEGATKSRDNRKSAKVCFSGARVDRKADDRPAHPRSACSSATKPPKASRRRTVSGNAPLVSQPVSQQASRAPRRGHAPAAVEWTKSSNKPSAKSSVPPQLRQRTAAAVKPDMKNRAKPAWK